MVTNLEALKRDLVTGPLYFKLCKGKFAESVARVEYAGETVGCGSEIWVSYTPTWLGLRDIQDLREETWFHGASAFQKLSEYLLASEASRVPPDSIPNWVAYFEGVRHEWPAPPQYLAENEIPFAVGTQSLQELFMDLSKGALLAAKKLGFRTLISIIRARKLTTSLDFALALSVHLKMNGVALALVPLDRKVFSEGH